MPQSNKNELCVVVLLAVCRMQYASKIRPYKAFTLNLARVSASLYTLFRSGKLPKNPDSIH